MMKRVILIGVSVGGALVIVLLACLAFVFLDAKQAWVGSPEYVALGSSYASGPFLTQRASHSPLLCARSRDNYAHQVARDLGLNLIDMSCAGATTVHVLRGGQFFQGPQVGPIDGRTRLVTLTIGGNDAYYLSNLVAESCDGHTPWRLRALGVCKIKSDAAVDQGFAAASRNMAQIIQAIHQRAPHARIIFVNYLTALPQTGTCARLGLTQTQADQMRPVAKRLATITAEAAANGGGGVLDAASLSAGHNVCAPDPWLAGAHPTTPHTAALHPNLAGMTAVAKALEQAWRGA